MAMRRYAVLCLAAVLAVALIGGSAYGFKPEDSKYEGWEIRVAPDRENGLYKAGETITFVIGLIKDAQPATEGDVAFDIQANGTKRVKDGTVKIASGGATVTTQSGEPASLIITVRWKSADGKEIKAESGVVVDAEKLTPSLPAPEDFDTFWAEQKKKLAAVPMNPRLTPVAPPNESFAKQVECFDVQLDCPGGASVSGYFARPKEAKPRSCPAIISFHGAGARSSNLSGPAGGALRGRLAMDINAHGSPNGKPAEYYKEALANGELKEYWLRGIESRETYYFVGMYLRLARAMEFLTSQPEWDGRTLITTGSSQGGAQAIIAAGLEPRVTVVYASLPALCDLGGQTAGRVAGWPIGSRKVDDRQVQVLRYFDVCNFAARTKATAVIRVGLVDHTCWPAGVLSMCNQLKGEKHVVTSPASGHAYSPPEEYTKANKVFDEVLAAVLAKAEGDGKGDGQP